MAKRDPELGPLDVMVSATLAIGDDVEDRLAWAKPQLALYIGGMGARGKNFYHNLATRYGFGDVADHIQDLYLCGQEGRGDRRGARRLGAARIAHRANAVSSRNALPPTPKPE